jgi:hypothetical protein
LAPIRPNPTMPSCIVVLLSFYYQLAACLIAARGRSILAAVSIEGAGLAAWGAAG